MRIVTLIAGAALLLAIGCKDAKKQSTSPQGSQRSQTTMTVVGHIVKTGPVSEPVQLPGTLLPMEETEIHAEVSGRVVSHSINEGALVNAGTVEKITGAAADCGENRRTQQRIIEDQRNQPAGLRPQFFTGK
jgi:membrane fusion protein (multidrug efflux system)